MSKSSSQNPSSEHPEFGVRAETIGRFFSPPLASSTFHDFVNKGKIVPMKGVRGFYRLNDSLHRLGLREVTKLPQDVPTRTTEETIRLAFHSIDPDLFPAPSWLLTVEAITEVDLRHAEMIVHRHKGDVEKLTNDRLKIAYLQGVLDAAVMMDKPKAG